MRVYTVHEPPMITADRIDRAEQLVFVRDGFSFGALLFAPFWFAARNMWLPLLVYVIAALALTNLPSLFGLPLATGLVALLGLHVFIGFEASSLYRWSLARSGWNFNGSVVGRTLAECERRFFDRWLQSEPIFSGSRANDAGGLQHVPSPPPVKTVDAAAAAPEAGGRSGWFGWRSPRTPE